MSAATPASVQASFGAIPKSSPAAASSRSFSPGAETTKTPIELRVAISSAVKFR
jgi:hypothetical protein